MVNMRRSAQRIRIWGSILVGIFVLMVFGCNGNDHDRTFTLRIENISPAFEFTASGSFDTPAGATGPGPIGPGGAYELTFSAAPGDRLSFVTMFVPSNDFFFAPDEDGIVLFDAGNMPVTGDVTDQVMLWDAGTEVNQEPGVGADQVQRQAAPGTGAPDPDNRVRIAPDTFNNLPPTNAIIRVTLTPISDTQFTLRIENVSDATTLLTSAASPDDMQAVPLSPGVFVVHTGAAPLFTVGQADRGEGLEAIAEDGDSSQLAAALADRTGLTVPLSPGIIAVDNQANLLFTVGQADRGEGLEGIAEDGDPSQLAASLMLQLGISSSALTFNTPVGATAPAPIGPGGVYAITFSADPGDQLSFVTMFVPSNDFFFAPDGNGIDLFNVNNIPVTGDVTSQVLLWDAGTEVNQEPGVGPDQVQRQAAPNTGAPDPDDTVRLAPDTFGNLPPSDTILRVTLTLED
ncbi:MAG: spondin domain-containing protein [bacterium]|nr:spondin domain-containing protein [bacterium]